MICNVNRLRKPADPYLCKATAAALKFMTDHGLPGYEIHIQNAQSIFDEIQAEAGPGGPDCPETQRQLDDLDAEIEETARAALDRYEDWVTDC